MFTFGFEKKPFSLTVVSDRSSGSSTYTMQNTMHCEMVYSQDANQNLYRPTDRVNSQQSGFLI